MSSIKKISYSLITVVAVFLLIVFASCSCNNQEQNSSVKNIGVAWCSESNYNDILLAVDQAGGKGTVLPEVKFNEFKYDGDQISAEYLDSYGMLTNENAEKVKNASYDQTNVKEVLGNYKSVIFPGGSDICPSLYEKPQAWYDYNDKPSFNPGRDVSDYLLMRYCLEHDIALLGICRGMQMYAVVTGCELTQDLQTYYTSKGVAYNDEHIKSGELDGQNVRGNHPVNITDKHSIMYNIWDETTLLKPYSAHHQAVIGINSQKSKAVATATVNGVEIIEGLERADSGAFGLFVQFHPEHSLAAWVNDKPFKDRFMNYDESLKPFKYLVENVTR